MSRVLFSFLLSAIAVPIASLQAEEPLSGGTLVLTGSGTYNGAMISAGTTQMLTVTAGTDENGNKIFTAVAPSGGTVGTWSSAGTLVILGNCIGDNTYSGVISGAAANPSLNWRPRDQGVLDLSGGVPDNPNWTTGTLTLSGSNTYSGGTSISAGAVTFPVGTPQQGNVYSYQVVPYGGATVTTGALQLNNGNWSSAGGNDTYTNTATATGYLFDNTVTSLTLGSSPGLYSLSMGQNAAPTSPRPIPGGPVFYIITEGAGLGDNVRSVPCTGKQTVLDAIGHLNGLSQISSSKIWIARPSATDHDKSTILNVDWEAISKHGINTTNFTLMPGDRLVVGEDSEVKRNNLIAKKTSPVERIAGIVGLSSSTLDGLRNLSAADRQLLRQFARKGIFTDDEEFKRIILDTIDASDQGNKKAGAKANDEQKAGQGEENSSRAGPKAAAKGEPVQIGGNVVVTLQFSNEGEKKSNPAAEAPPHELAMRPLPDYQIEPPDVIQIEMLKMVPLQSGTAAAAQPVTGQYLVGPDGTINLRKYGRVCLMGKTIAEARSAIEKQLAAYLKSPEVAVDVVAYNSHVYFVIVQGAGMGDSVRRLPITGRETVLDAISQINGLSQISSRKIWIVRPSGADPEKRILNVDWDAISRRGDTATNFQIFPGDRVYVGEDPLITRTNLLSKKTAPVERICGVIGLTTSTLRSLNGMSAADSAALKDLVQKGKFTDDEEIKGILLEAIRQHDVDREKGPPKDTQKGKTGE